MRLADAVLCASATEAIVGAASAFAAGRTLLVPALYCHGLYRRLLVAGVHPRLYDVGPDLAGDSTSLMELRNEHGADIGAVLWLHPFGRFAPPPHGLEVPVIEDGCFSLASAIWTRTEYEPADLLVFSARKEFRWRQGGLIVGSRAAEFGELSGRADEGVTRAWRGALDGTEHGPCALSAAEVIAALGKVLPGGYRSADMLSVLPLLAADRDHTVAALRAVEVNAWYWREGLPGRNPGHTPTADALEKRLFFVSVASAAPDLLGPLASASLQRWPSEW